MSSRTYCGGGLRGVAHHPNEGVVSLGIQNAFGSDDVRSNFFHVLHAGGFRAEKEVIVTFEGTVRQ